MPFNQDFIKVNPNKKLFITHVGGGDLLLNDIKSDFNASEFLIGSQSPYSTEYIDDILGYKPKHYCTEEISRKLAIYSFQKVIKYTNDIENCIGIGLTCIVQKENERDGRLHKVYICKHEFDKTTMFVCDDFYKYLYNVREFNNVESEIFIRRCEILHISDILKKLLLTQLKVNSDYWKVYHSTTKKAFSYYVGDNSKNMLVFPGSFNPFHQGHKDCIDVAKQILPNYKLFLEISTYNRDKGFVDYFEIIIRTSGVILDIDWYPIITNAKFFVDKVKFIKEINPSVENITFIIGDDTLVRIITDDYSKNGKDLTFFKNNNVRFIKFNRVYANNYTPSNYDTNKLIQELYDGYYSLCIKHKLLDNFSSNYSSTEIRNNFRKLIETN